MHFYETSAKHNVKVEDAFLDVSRQILDKLTDAAAQAVATQDPAGRVKIASNPGGMAEGARRRHSHGGCRC